MWLSILSIGEPKKLHSLRKMSLVKGVVGSNSYSIKSRFVYFNYKIKSVSNVLIF